MSLASSSPALEKLRVQLDGKIVQFFLRVHCVFDFLLGLFVGVGINALERNSRGEPASVKLLRVLQLDFQLVETAVTGG